MGTIRTWLIVGTLVVGACTSAAQQEQWQSLGEIKLTASEGLEWLEGSPGAEAGVSLFAADFGGCADVPSLATAFVKRVIADETQDHALQAVHVACLALEKEQRIVIAVQSSQFQGGEMAHRVFVYRLRQGDSATAATKVCTAEEWTNSIAYPELATGAGGTGFLLLFSEGGDGTREFSAFDCTCAPVQVNESVYPWHPNGGEVESAVRVILRANSRGVLFTSSFPVNDRAAQRAGEHVVEWAVLRFTGTLDVLDRRRFRYRELRDLSLEGDGEGYRKALDRWNELHQQQNERMKAMDLDTPALSQAERKAAIEPEDVSSGHEDPDLIEGLK